MPKSKRHSESVILPPVGSVFLMPLPNGRFGACRVIRHDKRFSDTSRALVIASRWIGTVAPRLDEPLLREPLTKTHHSWKNQIEAFYAFDNVPEDFQLLGTLVPTNEDMRLECSSLANWCSAQLQVLIQWRWDNERDALLAEDELSRQRKQAADLEKQRERQNYLAHLTLDKLKLKSKRRFATWKGGVSQELTNICRHVFDETIDMLMKCDDKPRKRRVVSILQKCVDRLNQLDAEHHFIETVEREELCQEIDEIICACGFPKDEGIADRWREW
jgi:hypothetical protein